MTLNQLFSCSLPRRAVNWCRTAVCDLARAGACCTPVEPAVQHTAEITRVDGRWASNAHRRDLGAITIGQRILVGAEYTAKR